MTDELRHPVVDHLTAGLDAYVADLTKLASIDSGSYSKMGIDRVQTIFADRLAASGFEIDRRSNAEWGDDLVARRRGVGKGRVLLIGHADTVYPDGTAAARPVRIDGDILLGPGTCDMKAGILSGICAIEALDGAGWRDYELLTVLVVSDEEIETRHSVELLREEGPKHHAVLTLEAARANGDIVTSRKATRWLLIEAQGRAAHAGVEPEKGASATLAIAHVITACARVNGMKSGMTVNVGRLRGGANPNIVADHADVLIDLRAWTNDDLEALVAEIQCVVDTEWVTGVTQTMRLNGGSGMPAMERSPGTIRLEELAIRTAADLGFPLKGTSTGGGSDVSIAVHAGTPGLDGLGPVGGLDHSPDEYIEVSSIVPRTALLALLIAGICADSEVARD